MTHQRVFTSLDRFTTCECGDAVPDRYRDLFGIDSGEPFSIRGAGLSYVGAGFADQVASVSLVRFNRILKFDPKEKWIEVEGGATMGQLFEFLVQQRLCLSVLPGYPAITVGGCIAANVHGKNHAREGTFGEWVENISLFHPDHGLLHLSRAENAELFDLTIGGYGLTGIIVSAKLRLVDLGGTAVENTTVPLLDMQDACDKVWQFAQTEDIAYGWIDLARTQGRKTRGFLTVGRLVEGPSFVVQGRKEPCLEPSAERTRLPILSSALLPLINRAYYFNSVRKKKSLTSLYSALFPIIGKEFYFDWYGGRGFIEHQIILPCDAQKSYFDTFDALRRKFDVSIGLATLKASRGQGGNLCYDGTGFNFTINVANTTSNGEFLRELDCVNTAHGAITNLIKDSRVLVDVVKAQYPEYETFKSALKDFDPKRVVQTSLSRRLLL